MTEAVQPELSVAIPVHDEQENLRILLPELTEALGSLGMSYEIVFVDDASRDESWDFIKSAARTDARVRGVRLQSQSGETAAIWSGLIAAKGSLLLTLASDLQNDPRDIKTLLDALRPGVDAVFGLRQKRNESIARAFASRIANFFRRILLGSSLRDSGCGFRLMRPACARRLPWYRGMHRFLGDALVFHGFSVVQVPIVDRPRVSGRTKYGIWGRLRAVVVDVLAVMWMRSRKIQPRIIESTHE